jgi:hypothetical protein
MPERKLVVSFGESSNLAGITKVRHTSWAQFSAWLTRKPPVAASKDSVGWYCPAEFENEHRHSDNFVSRHAITFDFDHVGDETAGEVALKWAKYAYALYTTFSHTREKWRFRVVLPLSRPAGYDEFQAVARKVAAEVGIELIARESFVPAQCMFNPAIRADGEHVAHVNEGVWIDVDTILTQYKDWTDVSEWPRRKSHDGLHLVREPQQPPNEKPGIVGDFCRTFSIPEAIARFNLPYTPTSNPERWTYIGGSRPEGAIVYDEGLKLHSHHDTDVARGQHNAFDLVRLHRFGDRDIQEDDDQPITERPSYKAMLEYVHTLPEINQMVAEKEFADLGELKDDAPAGRFVPVPAEEFTSGKPMEWIVRGVLPRAELCVIYGESGSGKSFLALDICASITRGLQWRGRKVQPGRVVYVCAEGTGGFRSRLRAYAQAHECEMRDMPAVIPDSPNLLKAKDASALALGILSRGQFDVVVIDTLSATTPGANENSGEDMGQVLAHCKAVHKATNALVILIHHAGKDASKGARGWSGLKAAADAEIEVSRNEEARLAVVTKMKDGQDGARLGFKLQVVSLGYDEEDEEESSCVVQHIDDTPRKPLPERKPKPTGAKQIILYDVLKGLAAGGSIEQDDLLTEAVERLPAPGRGERDMRRRDCMRALEGLSARKLAYIHGTRVSLNLIIAEEESWLE